MERPGKAPVRSVLAYVVVAGVMLVLALVAMIAAPLLTVGAPVELPPTQTSGLAAPDETVTVSIDRNGALFVGEVEVGSDGLVERLARDVGTRENPVLVRADGDAPYQSVAQVMTRLSAAGFTKVSLISDTAVANEEG